MKQYKIMTDENGDFSLDLPALEKGTYTMKAIFEGDSDAYGSEITKTLIIQGRAYAISIEADNEIIQLGDTTTLTLSFEDEDGDPVIEPGQTIQLYQEYVVSDIILTTDNQGKASYTYTGTGAGDVKFSAESTNNGSLVSETYHIFDCPIYDGDNTPTSINFSKTNNAVVTDEVVTLIASVKNTNNNPCINIPVVFKQGNTVLGTAYTDCTGDATITYTWADSDIFNVTAQVGQSLSEDITMFVKDKNNLLPYNLATGSDYRKTITDEDHTFLGISNLSSSTEWSSNGNRSIKHEKPTNTYCEYTLTNIDTTKSYEGSIKIHNPDSKLQFFLITKANGVNVSIKSITINESAEDNTATLNLTSSDLTECTTIQFRVLSINGPFYTDDWKLILH